MLNHLNAPNADREVVMNMSIARPKRQCVQGVRMLLSSLVLAGFVGGAVLPVSSAASASPSPSVPLHTGDKVQVTVYNHPDISTQAVVNSDGSLPVPVIGAVPVGGLTPAAASQIIEHRLTAYINHPAADVRLIEQGQFVFVSGSTIGVLAYEPGETLVSAIGGNGAAKKPAVDAGQNTAAVPDLKNDSIDLRNVRLQRDKATTGPYNVEQLARTGEPGPVLQPGDRILVSNKPVRVDVHGDIPKPGPVYVYEGETLAQAIGEAGGMTPTASSGNITLTRGGQAKVVSYAGSTFTAPAQNGDAVTIPPADRVNVLGMVDKPGETLLKDDSTLLSALYHVGGPNKYADLKHIEVIHRGVHSTYNISNLTHGDLSGNAPLADGDVVFVPEGHRIDIQPFLNALGSIGSFGYFLKH